MIRVEITLDVLEDQELGSPPASLAHITRQVEERLADVGTIVTLNAERHR